MPERTDLIVALDYPKAAPALNLINELQGLPVIYKVGLELFLSEGATFVRELVHQKHRIFLDLKLHDIPNTVRAAVRQATLLHVEYLTVHLSGGKPMVKAAMEDLENVASLRPKILGVSVLTSFDDLHWSEVTCAMTGHPSLTENAALGLMEAGLSWGVDGVVCSAHELSAIRHRHSSVLTVVPGIRPEGSRSDDQARVVTPKQAKEMGASLIVVGRPITQASDPKKVTESILKDL